MTTFQLPNLNLNSHIRLSYIINKKQYNFVFQWLDEFGLLSIYVIKDNQKVYLVKGRAMVPDVDLLSRIKDKTLISGQLIIKNKYNEDIKITQSNFHTDFEMEYYGE